MRKQKPWPEKAESDRIHKRSDAIKWPTIHAIQPVRLYRMRSAREDRRIGWHEARDGGSPGTSQESSLDGKRKVRPWLLGKGIGSRGEGGRPRKHLTGAVGPGGARQLFSAAEYHIT